MLKVLSAATIIAFSLQAQAAPDPVPSPRPQSTTTAAAPRGLMRYDTNKDGFVDRAEWDAGQQARFKQLDTDGDGKLSRDELFARTPSSGDNVLPTEAQLRRQDSFFRLLDADRDGFVSKEEFMTQANRNFARCDLDKDGRITVAECRQALRRRPAEPARAER